MCKVGSWIKIIRTPSPSPPSLCPLSEGASIVDIKAHPHVALLNNQTFPQKPSKALIYGRGTLAIPVHLQKLALEIFK